MRAPPHPGLPRVERGEVAAAQVGVGQVGVVQLGTGEVLAVPVDVAHVGGGAHPCSMRLATRAATTTGS